ncbi:DMT family transporter [Actinoplanes auranticolor]|uniref:Cation transporter n=1 Tax=Actinoplanes auranticolor TaxID=47988 RepID=A0A919S531_9ACTN|nr:SMR family transporter [Actinoplanes auranticolor]GIM63970.1 cation transporter [Actinoplanes auranticolor]
MKKWLVLAAAIGSEVAATLALKAALGHPAWYVLVVAGYVAAFVFLAACLGLKIGVAYGVWAASGVALTAVLARLIPHEPLTRTMGAGILLISAGVLLVELGAQAAH